MKRQLEIKREEVKQAYKSKRKENEGGCRCGCGGKYSSEYASGKLKEKMINEVLSMVNQGIRERKVDLDSSYADFWFDNRNWTVYFQD